MTASRVHVVRVPPDAALDPLALLEVPAARRAAKFYWSDPDTGEAIAGVGAAYTVTTAGAARLAEAAARCWEVTAELAGAGAPEGLLRWLGGFAFDADGGDAEPWEGFGPLCFTLPAATLHRRGGDARLALVSLGGPARRGEAEAKDLLRSMTRAAETPAAPPGDAPPVPRPDRDDPALAQARDQVSRALAEIHAGRVDKVVLSTAWTVRMEGGWDPIDVLRRLRERQPGCFHFLVSPRPGLAFLGASPERLAAVRDRSLRTIALAGSARRGGTPEEDAALGAALLASAKDRAEHEMVVAAIRQVLEGYPLEVPESPQLRRLATIQHLETPIRARLPGPGDVLAEAARLHPTPALGGTPREAALGLIRELEGRDRGWYGGGVGWLDGRGDGDITVAIRSLLLRDDEATAFAGAGIVAGSDPAAEAEEMALKMSVMLEALVP